MGDVTLVPVDESEDVTLIPVDDNIDFGAALGTQINRPKRPSYNGSVYAEKPQPTNIEQSLVTNPDPQLTAALKPSGLINTTKELGKSIYKAGTSAVASVGNLLEGDPDSVNRNDVGIFGTSDTESFTDEDGNTYSQRTAPESQLVEEQKNSLMSRIGSGMRSVDKGVKGGDFEEGSALGITGQVIENLPRSLMYMVPNLAPGGGNVSNALMYQDAYLQRLKDLREAKEQGKIELNEEEMQAAAVKYGVYEAGFEMAGNSAQAAIIKAGSFGARFLPLGGSPSVIRNFVAKVAGSKSGASLFNDISQSATKRVGSVGIHALADAPLEAASETGTEKFQAEQDLDLGMVKLPLGMTREEYIQDRMKNAAIVGGVSGAATTGGFEAVGQVSAGKQSVRLKEDLFAPVTQDRVAKFMAEGQSLEQAKLSAAHARSSAANEMMGVIEASGIPEEEKQAARDNITKALLSNAEIPYSADMFTPGAVEPTPGGWKGFESQPVGMVANDYGWDKFAAEEGKVPVPDTGISDDSVTVDDAIAAANASVGPAVGSAEHQSDLLAKMNGGEATPVDESIAAAANEAGVTPAAPVSSPSANEIESSSTHAIQPILEMARAAKEAGTDDYPAFANQVAQHMKSSGIDHPTLMTHLSNAGYEGLTHIWNQAHAVAPAPVAEKVMTLPEQISYHETNMKAWDTMANRSKNVAQADEYRRKAQEHRDAMTALSQTEPDNVPGPSPVEQVSTPLEQVPLPAPGGETSNDYSVNLTPAAGHADMVRLHGDKSTEVLKAEIPKISEMIEAGIARGDSPGKIYHDIKLAKFDYHRYSSDGVRNGLRRFIQDRKAGITTGTYQSLAGVDTTEHSHYVKAGLNSKGDIDRSDIPMTPEQQQVQEDSIAQVLADPEKAVQDYLDLMYGEKYGPGVTMEEIMANEPVEVNTDEARPLFDGYNKDKMAMSLAVHEASSSVAKMVLAKALAIKDPRGFNQITILGGGGGSGKGSALKSHKDRKGEKDLKGIKEKSQIIFDGTFSNLDRAVDIMAQIEKADSDIGVHRKVYITHVHRGAEQAVQGVVDRKYKTGRDVAIPALADAHMKSGTVFITLESLWRDNPRYEFIAIDNMAEFDPRPISVDAFIKLFDNKVAGRTKAEFSAHMERTYNEYDAAHPKNPANGGTDGKDGSQQRSDGPLPEVEGSGREELSTPVSTGDSGVQGQRETPGSGTVPVDKGQWWEGLKKSEKKALLARVGSTKSPTVRWDRIEPEAQQAILEETGDNERTDGIHERVQSTVRPGGQDGAALSNQATPSTEVQQAAANDLTRATGESYEVATNLTPEQKDTLEVTAALGITTPIFVTKSDIFNGVYWKDNIFLAQDTPHPMIVVAAHEISHSLEKADGYFDVMDKVIALADPDSRQDYHEWLEGVRKIKMSTDEVNREILADLTATRWHDKEFWKGLSMVAPKLFKAIAKAIDRLLDTGKANGLDVTDLFPDLEAVKKIIDPFLYANMIKGPEVSPEQRFVSDYENLAGVEPQFSAAWHGSPHDHDKFEVSKIGTGEGAQAYGYGLYFAGNREVAEYYKDKLSGIELTKKGNDEIDRRVESRESSRFRAELDVVAAGYANASKGWTKSSGKLYKVELAPAEDEYLLWDKPLSEQSEKVRESIKTLPFYAERLNRRKGVEGFKFKHPDELNGMELYGGVSREVGGGKAASEYLHSLGIRGIKYADGNTRNKEDQDFNYVIFDENDISIEAKFSIKEREFGLRKMALTMKKRLGVTEGEASKYVDEYFEKIGTDYAAFLEQVTANKEAYPEMGTGSLPKNSDPTYKVTVDLVGACVRMLRAMAIHKHVRDTGKDLNSFQMRALETELNKHGFDLTCAYCYAFTRRTNAIAKLEEMQADLQSGVMPKDAKDTHEDLWKAALEEADANPGWADDLRSLPDLVAIKTPADFAELEKVSPEAAKFAEKYPAIHALKQKVTDAGNMKMPTGTIAIAGQIVSIPDSMVADLKKWGGLRWQSSVDYIPAMTYDYVQGVVEMAMRGVAGHTYTKEIDLALLLSNSGFKVNLSAAPLVRDGKVVWEGTGENRRPVLDVGIGSMRWEDIEKAYEASPDHAGVMMLGVNDEVLTWATTSGSKWAPYVIPWHSSGMPAFISKTFKKVIGAVDYSDAHEGMKHYKEKADVPLRFRLIATEFIGKNGKKTGEWVIDYTQLGKINKKWQHIADEYTLQQTEYRKASTVDSKALLDGMNIPTGFVIDQTAGLDDVAATEKYFALVEDLNLEPLFESYRARFEKETGKHHGERFWVLKKHYSRTDTPLLPPDPKGLDYEHAKKLDREWSNSPMAKAITDGDTGFIEAYRDRVLTQEEQKQIKAAVKVVMSDPTNPMAPVLGNVDAMLPQMSVKKNRELKEFLKYSKVKKPMYHATIGDFNVFDTTGRSDLGSHFGTMDQANNVAMFRNNGEGSIMPVWLNIENPLRLKDVGTFHADGIAEQLERKGIIPKGEGKRIRLATDRDWKLRKEFDPELRQAIIDAGYDGVVYDNTAPHEGKGDSYIAFYPNQIKSATGNTGTFSPDDGDIRYSLKPSVVRSLNYETKWPAMAEYKEAVENTPGAKLVEDGAEIDLVRFQKPEQDSSPSVRTGVFYLPAGSKAARYYKTKPSENDTQSYGGSVKLSGDTLLKAPLVVKAATGGKAPEIAYDQLKGKGAYEAVRQSVFTVLPYTGFVQTFDFKRKMIAEVLQKYGADPKRANDIVTNSTRGNQLVYAVTENVVAHAVRAAGYDSVVGISKSGGKPVLAEIFDVREQAYPGEDGYYNVHPYFEGAPKFSLKEARERLSEKPDLSLEDPMFSYKGRGSVGWPADLTGTRAFSAIHDRQARIEIDDSESKPLVFKPGGYTRGEDHAWMNTGPMVKPKVTKTDVYVNSRGDREATSTVTGSAGQFIEHTIIIPAGYKDWDSKSGEYIEVDDTWVKERSAFMAMTYAKKAMSKAAKKSLWQGETLGKVLQHQELYEAYPALSDIPVMFVPQSILGKHTSGLFGGDYILIGSSGIKATKGGKQLTWPAHKTLLHEIQHYIQDKENFARGTNSKDAGGFGDYWLTAGEFEARDVANRLDLPADRRANIPFGAMTEDERTRFPAKDENGTYDVEGIGKGPLRKLHVIGTSKPPQFSPRSPRTGGNLPEETLAQKFQRNAQDKFNRLGVLQDWLEEQGVNLSEQANVKRGLETMQGKVADQLSRFMDNQIEPLIKEAAKKKIKLSDIENYLLMNHAQEANKAMQDLHKDPTRTAFGVTDAEARRALADYRARADFADLQRLASRFQGFSEESADMLLDAGIISQEMRDAWSGAYQNYVPVRGGEDDIKAGTGKGQVVKRGLQRRAGHSLRDEHVIENIIKMRESAIKTIEKNKVNLQIAQLILEAKDDNIGTIGKPELRRVFKNKTVYTAEFKGTTIGVFNNEAEADAFVTKHISQFKTNIGDYVIDISRDPIVTMMVSPQLGPGEINAYVAGHQVRIQINDQVAADALTNVGAEGLGRILSVGREINNWFSRAYTGYDPRFTIRNTIRDFTSGMVNLTGDYGLPTAAKIALNYPRAVRAFWQGRNDPTMNSWIDRYRKQGGSTGASYLSSLERLGDDVQTMFQEHLGAIETYKNVYAEQKALGRSDMMAKTKAIARSGLSASKKIPVLGHFLKIIQGMNSISENAFRVATFMTLVEQGKSEAEAGQAAKNSTINFDKKGEMGAQAGALYLFFNPAVQGIQRSIFALSQSKHKHQAQALVGSMAFAGYLAAELARSMGDDDDEWDKVGRSVKNRNLVIRTGEKSFLTIPLPYEYGSFVGIGYAMNDAVHGKFDKKSGLNLAATIMDGFSPLGNPVTDQGLNENSIFQMLPTVVKLATAPKTNIGSFGSEIAPKKFSETKPDSQNMYRGTKGSYYEDVASFANEMTGGSKYSSGAVDVSPEILKFYTRSLLGGAFTFIDQVKDFSKIVGTGGTPEIAEIPMVAVLAKENTIKDSRREFWEIAKDAKQAVDQYNAAKKDRNFEVAGKLKEDNLELLAVADIAAKQGKLAKAKRDAVDAIRLNEDLSFAEKRERIKDIEDQEVVIYDKLIKAFNQ